MRSRISWQVLESMGVSASRLVTTTTSPGTQEYAEKVPMRQRSSLWQAETISSRMIKRFILMFFTNVLVFCRESQVLFQIDRRGSIFVRRNPRQGARLIVRVAGRLVS